MRARGKGFGRFFKKIFGRFSGRTRIAVTEELKSWARRATGRKMLANIAPEEALWRMVSQKGCGIKIPYEDMGSV